MRSSNIFKSGLLIPISGALVGAVLGLVLWILLSSEIEAPLSLYVIGGVVWGLLIGAGNFFLVRHIISISNVPVKASVIALINFIIVTLLGAFWLIPMPDVYFALLNGISIATWSVAIVTLDGRVKI